VRRRCVENLLRGLVYLERHGIVHGDLSPNNVIIDVEASADRPML
jgi:RIO-like serine/threonine protein kinase